MISWRVGGPSYLGVFFVKKKTGKLRIIFDTRDVNNLFRPPPTTRLPTAAAFSRLESGGVDEIWFAAGDIEDCFYHIGMPEGLEQ